MPRSERRSRKRTCARLSILLIGVIPKNGYAVFDIPDLPESLNMYVDPNSSYNRNFGKFLEKKSTEMRGEVSKTAKRFNNNDSDWSEVDPNEAFG